MAASVASLLTESIQKSDLFSKLAQSPVVRAGILASKVAKVTGQDLGKVGGAATKLGIGGFGGGGGIAGKAMSGMAAHIGEFLPKLGKLAGPTQLLGLPKKLLSKGMGLVGINLSLSTLLRQSQLFTGILGALFQILGGFVDVILTPFMPFFIKIIRKLAEQIPKVREIAQKVFDWLNTNVFPVIKRGFDWIWGKVQIAVDWISEHMPEIKEKITGFWDDNVKPALDRAKEIMKEVWDWIKTNIWPVLQEAFTTLVGIGKTAWEFIKATLWPVVKNILGNVVTIIEGMLKWLREDIFPLVKQFWDWAIKEVGGLILWLADNIVERLVTIIPLIQRIITQVLDILINSIMKPLWAALEPIFKWWVNTMMDNWTFIIRMIEGKILPFIKDIIDDLMPHIQDLSEFFMAHIAPRITEYFEALRDFVDAFLDVALPLIKWLLKHVVWPVAKFLLKGLGILLIVVFKVMSWILKGLTWLLRLPFMWRQSLLDPILSVLDFGFDWVKKIFWLAKNARGMLKVAMLDVLSTLLRKISGGTIKGGKWLPDIPLSFLKGTADKLATEFWTAERKLNMSRSQMVAGLSTSTGGMRQIYGTTSQDITINNYTERHVLDSTQKFVRGGDEKREIDNVLEMEASLGTYDDIPAGLV